MKHSSLLRLAIVLGVISIFLTGCSRDPNVRKQKYFESGQRYYEKGKYREAVIQFRNATDVDQTFAAAHYQLARVLEKVGQADAARREFRKIKEQFQGVVEQQAAIMEAEMPKAGSFLK